MSDNSKDDKKKLFLGLLSLGPFVLTENQVNCLLSCGSSS